MFLPKTPFSKSNHFGISINSSGIRVMCVNSSGKPTKSASKYFSQPIIQGDQINSDLLLETLKIVLDEAKINQQYAAIAIPEKFAYSREYTLPNLKPDEIDEAINWQIEKIFPFSKKEVYADWKLISQTKEQSKVMVTVIPKIILDQLKSTLQAAGVFPISFEPSTSALARLLNTKESKKLIILELENTSTTASLVVDGIAILTSTTNFDQQTAPDAVMSQINTSIQGIMTHLKKIELTPEELHILITGEKANQDIADFLTKSLKMSTKIMTVSDISPEDHLVYIAASVNILPPQSEKSINLLPTSLQEYYQAQMNYNLSKSVTTYTVSFVVLGLLISSLVFGAIFWTKFQTQNQLSLTQQQTQLVGSSNFKVSEVNKKSLRVVKLFPLKVSPEQYLVAVYNSIPDDVIIHEVVLNNGGKSIKVAGIVKDRDAMVGLRDSIASSGIFSTPKIPLSSYQDVENSPFSITFQVKDQAK